MWRAGVGKLRGHCIDDYINDYINDHINCIDDYMVSCVSRVCVGVIAVMSRAMDQMENAKTLRRCAAPLTVD